MDVRSLTRPDVWATDLKLRVDGRPFDLAGREYIAQVMRDGSRIIVVKKAAQTAFTISFLVRTFHWIVMKKWHHLYLLPTKIGSTPFVQKRIDPIINSNPTLKSQFATVDNRGHKQSKEDISLLVRGVNVESEMQETPADVLVFDEYDRMDQTFLEDAIYRTSGSKIKRRTYLSTPSVPGHGVDSDDMWHASDQHLWEVKCPHCGRYQVLTFEDNVQVGEEARDCVVECSFCNKVISDEDRAAMNATGRWVPQVLDARKRGYHINQLNSPTVPIEDFMDGYFRGQFDMKVLKAWHNQAKGEPFVAAGDQISVQLLDSCKDNYQLGGIPASSVFIGVDVGYDEIYVKADVITRFGERRMWNIWHFKDKANKSAWDMLDEKVLAPLSSWVCICDAHPDKRAANALSVKYPGKFFLGFEKDRPEQDEAAVFEKVTWGEASKVIIDRTMAFDSTIHQMMNGNYLLPRNARELGEFMPKRDYNGFYSHMIQQVRVEEEDTRGRVVASWKKNKNKDHWHHADMFAWVATLRRPSLRVAPNVQRAFQRAGGLVGAS